MQQPLKIALATCSTLPEWEVDDEPFFQALKNQNIEIFHPCWDDSDFDWDGCDLVIPRTTWDYQSRSEQFAQWLERVDQCSFLLNPLSLIKWNLNKTYLKDLSIAQPPTIWLSKTISSSSTPRPNLQKLLNQKGWSKGFIKPVVGANSWGTIRFDQENHQSIKDAQIHLDQWIQTHDLILQPYYKSVETEGEFSLIFFNGKWSHGVQKVPVLGDYRVQDDYGAKDYPWNPPSEWKSQTLTLINNLPICPLYARADFLKDDSGDPRLIELELIEPSLFFRHDSDSPHRFVTAILDHLKVGY